jgi:Flp pilus assembly protein TadD
MHFTSRIFCGRIFCSRIFCLCLIALALAGCATSPNTTARTSRSTTPAKQTKTAQPQKTPEPPKIEPKVSAESRQSYKHALDALKAEKYPEAERILLALTAREPKLAGPYANLGIVYARTGRSAQAVESLRKAIDLNPDNAAYHNELGLVFRQDGKFDEARRAYAKAIDIKPDYAYAHLNIGILYDLYLQEGQKALPHYERYRELAPNEAGTVSKWIVELQRRKSASENGGSGGNG